MIQIQRTNQIQIQRTNQKVCFISGARHSGSTLLGLILGSHSDCFYAGEVGKTSFFDDTDAPLRQRVCKLCGTEPCPIWTQIDPRLEADGLDLYEQLSRRSQQPIVIDSTKKTDWLQRRIQLIQTTEAQPFLIFIQRDGRAVVNSRLRKFPDREARDVMLEWKTRIETTQALYDQFSGQKIKIHYEDLATQPETIVRTLCHFLGIDFQPAMLSYYNHDHHLLGGNDGTQSLVLKAQQEKSDHTVVELSDRRRDYYDEHPLGIHLDMRWQQELDPKLIQLFEEVAGSVNEDLRWEP